VTSGSEQWIVASISTQRIRLPCFFVRFSITLQNGDGVQVTGKDRDANYETGSLSEVPAAITEERYCVRIRNIVEDDSNDFCANEI
jgi:hypothetical protein